ncbi:MAG: hypothetical protein HY706_22535 [Candidatus Hydrogenedentes bacterium]|nr:hypothetical protein [Candidatus Hydrogenedentota bacterium]
MCADNTHKKRRRSRHTCKMISDEAVGVNPAAVRVFSKALRGRRRGRGADLWRHTDWNFLDSSAGFSTDDFIAFTTEPGGAREAKLLAQIKHAVAITEGDDIFEGVICAARADFNDRSLFDAEKDAIALITGPSSTVDTENARPLLEWASTSVDAKEFVDKVNRRRSSSNDKRDKLRAFRAQLGKAKGSSVTDDELWAFMKSFHLLGDDFDIENGVMVSLLRSVIGRNATAMFHRGWEKIVDHVQYVNQNAGTITVATVPADIREAFSERPSRTMPAELVLRRPSMSVGLLAIAQSQNELTMALMLGEWNDSSQADIRTIEVLTSTTYSEWIARVREILQQPDSPLSLRDGHWEVRERLQLRKELGPRVFDEHLDRFKKTAVTVLRERNPELDLEPERRYEGQLHGNFLKHSRHLRKGISSTLAILGNHQTLFTKCSSATVDAAVVLAVREILQGANWRLWASLDPVLPFLAEAAPDEFLDSVKRALQTTPRPSDELFAQEWTGILGRTYISGLLWAFEILAWEPKQSRNTIDWQLNFGVSRTGTSATRSNYWVMISTNHNGDFPAIW